MSRSPNENETAAIAAAIQRFVAETSAPGDAGRRDAVGPWQRAALIEGVSAKASIVDLEGEGGAKWLS
jgi:hypothetical protein